MDQSTFAFRFLSIFCITLHFFQNVNCGANVNLDGADVIGQSVYANGKVVNQYLALPYAEPPIGPLRFKKPAPFARLSDIYPALNHPPACWQRSEYPFPWYDSTTIKNEDCLYLNIWSPESASPTNKKAVIYFIHSGGFRFGSTAQLVYNGAVLAAHGDVVVVTVNYRLGPFGFLTSGSEDAPGNIGLYDILEGLKWVNKKIEVFGGDTSRITIAGLGSGSMAAGLLSTSPLAEGLFQRTIMESGSPGYPYQDAMKQNLAISQKVAERVFCANKTHTIQNNPSDVLKCLRNIRPETLSDVSASMHSLSSMLFVPQFGDELLPVDPVKAIQNKNFTCNNLLIGNTKDEGSHLLTTQKPAVYGFFGSLDPAINKTVGTKEIKQLLPTFPDKEAVAKHYLNNSIPSEAFDTIREQVHKSLGDVSVVCPATFYAEQCASKGGDVYYYVWNHRPSSTIWFSWMGVVHADDMQFVFGIPLLQDFHYQEDEVSLSKNIIEIWSSFAKNGKPSTPWPEFSKEKPQVKVLGPGSAVENDQTGFHRDNCEFFRPYFGF